MEPYSSAPVFVDVERSPERFLVPREMCPTTVAYSLKVETVTTSDGHAFDPRTSQCLPPMTSEIENMQMTSQSQVLPKTSSESVTATVQTEASKARQSGALKRGGPGAEPGAPPAPRRVRCPECARYTAENEEKMLRHIKKVHKGENPFQCYMCDYSTYNKSLFEEHVRIHQGIKPFKCSQCDYKSASKKNLKKHQLIHRPNNPLKCKQCDFIARHPRALKRHEETHSGANCYKFDSCKFQFQDLAAYKKHERLHKFVCKECEFKTCSRPFLKRHMVKQHGAEQNVKRESFSCQICGWTSSTTAKILLHLIHHPNQEVDESVIDVSILRKHGIM